MPFVRLTLIISYDVATEIVRADGRRYPFG